MTPSSTYIERRDRFEAQRAAEARRSNAVSAARLACFLLAIGLGVAAELRPAPMFVIGAIGFLATFIALIVWHGAIRRRERWFGMLRDLNEEGLRRLARDWDALPERPATQPDAQGVAEDLDLFGRPALAQLLGPVGTPRGRALLARWLLDGADAAELIGRQEAVRELAAMHDVREQLAAHGRTADQVRAADIDAFLAWAESPVQRTRPVLHVVSYVLPVVTIAAIVLSARGSVPGTLWLLPILASILLTAGPGRTARRTFRAAFTREGMFHGYPEMFEAVASSSFRSGRLRDLQDALAAGGLSAAAQMKRLARLMHLADLRSSGATYAFAQLILLWDFHVLRAVERWHEAAGGQVHRWLSALAELESLASLAALAHDHPAWAFPEFVDEPLLEAEALGHPMLPAAMRVDNDVRVGPPGTFLFVTGSNMSGKSTLLRALGANVVLGLAGAPACARRMRLPAVDLRTSIHVQDSIVEGVSFFMAQLRRLRDVVSAADGAARPGARRVLYLLDEILAGTNSAERRVAATRVIRHLVGTGALGAVTTHDLELGEQPELSDAARPVHFTETVTGTDGDVRMQFDYRLRPGVATSTNALRLMRLVGLDP